jgi:DNA-binding FrmR family transcriptional regulator
LPRILLTQYMRMYRDVRLLHHAKGVLRPIRVSFRLTTLSSYTCSTISVGGWDRHVLFYFVMDVGSVRALRGLNEDEHCADVLQRLAAARGAINALMGELMEDHIRNHMPKNSKSSEEAAEDVIEIVRTYLK